jgi:hypothetical protein
MSFSHCYPMWPVPGVMVLTNDHVPVLDADDFHTWAGNEMSRLSCRPRWPLSRPLFRGAGAALIYYRGTWNAISRASRWHVRPSIPPCQSAMRRNRIKITATELESGPRASRLLCGKVVVKVNGGLPQPPKKGITTVAPRSVRPLAGFCPQFCAGK